MTFLPRTSHFRAAVVVLAFLSAPLAAQQGPRTVSGIVRSAGQEPIAGALVIVDSAQVLHGARTGADGRFRLPNIPSGQHTIEVASTGYRTWSREFDVADADVQFDVVLQRALTQLDTVAVRAGRTGVYGQVIRSTDLAPLDSVTVSVLGAHLATVTDTAGRYDLPGVKPGNYVVRLTRAGYAERTRSITVERNKGYEFRPLLYPDPEERLNARRTILLDEMDRRVRERQSLLIPRSELGSNPRGDLSLYANRARTALIKSISIPDGSCIFVDGRPIPGFPLHAFSVGDVESVEVIVDAPGIERLWPYGAPCGQGVLTAQFMPPAAGVGVDTGSNGFPPLRSNAVGSNYLNDRLRRERGGSAFVFIWLRR